MDELLTVPEVAERLDRSPETIRRWIQLGLLEAIPLPTVGKRGRYRIKKNVVEAIEQRKKHESNWWESLIKNS